jgi:4-amino-4-deoxy-L-arabinose transferase-like glycosyltransferase
LAIFPGSGQGKDETMFELNRKRLGQTIVIVAGGVMVTTAIFVWQGKSDLTSVLLLLFGLAAILVGALFLGRSG